VPIRLSDPSHIFESFDTKKNLIDLFIAKDDATADVSLARSIILCKWLLVPIIMPFKLTTWFEVENFLAYKQNSLRYQRTVLRKRIVNITFFVISFRGKNEGKNDGNIKCFSIDEPRCNSCSISLTRRLDVLLSE